MTGSEHCTKAVIFCEEKKLEDEPTMLCAEKDGNKHMGLDIQRVQYWLSVGAQPSKTVAKLLGQAAIIPKPPPRQSQQLGTKKEQKGKK